LSLRSVTGRAWAISLNRERDHLADLRDTIDPMLRIAMIAVVACGPVNQPEPPTPPAREAVVRLRATLPGGELLRNPIVDGTVNGRRVQLLLDTGASLSVIAGWLARSARLDVRPAPDVTRDSVGITVQAQLARDVNVEITGFGRIAERDILVAELPPFFEQANVGAILSPQQLAPAGDAVILDLRRSRLTAGSSMAAILRFQRDAGPLLTRPWVRACANAASLLPNVEFSVPATLDGQAALLDLDTGAEVSSVRAASKAGEALGTRAGSYGSATGISGSTTTQIARDTTIAAGEVVAKADVRLVTSAENPTCPSDGLLGMDVLQRCTLVLTRLQALVRCNP
jgi:predicted aspartyl protease